MKIVIDIPEVVEVNEDTIQEVLDYLLDLVTTTSLPEKDIVWGEPNRLSWFDARELAEKLSSEHTTKHHLIRVFLRIGKLRLS